MFHSHVWYIACNLFCNVFYCMQALTLRGREAAPQWQLHLPKVPRPLLTVHCRQITARPAHHLHLIHSSMTRFKAHKSAELGAIACCEYQYFVNTCELLIWGWRVGRISMLSIKFTHRLVNFSAPHTSIHGRSCRGDRKFRTISCAVCTEYLFNIFTIYSKLPS